MQPCQQANSPVIGDLIGHDDFLDKAIVGSPVHALRARRNILPPRLAAEFNADAVSPALGAVAVTFPLGWIAKPVTMAAEIPAKSV